MSAAFPPIPPLTDRGAGVFVSLPILTPELKSLDKVSSPLPFGVNVRFEFDVVPMVAGEPAPKLRVVALMPNKAAVVRVSREDPLMEVVPVSVTVSALVSRILPLAPFNGESSIFPVLSPPITKVLFFKL